MFLSLAEVRQAFISAEAMLNYEASLIDERKFAATIIQLVKIALESERFGYSQADAEGLIAEWREESRG